MKDIEKNVLKRTKNANDWVKKFLKYTKEYPDWRLDYDINMEFSMHSVDVLCVLCSKEVLDESEEKIVKLALRYAHPNEFDDDDI